jgi:hypothetical protein
MTRRQIINRMIKGRTALPISMSERFIMAIETKRFRPKGGVKNPHSIFTIMMMPKWM